VEIAMQLTLRRDVWIGDAPVRGDEGEVVQYAVLGAGSDSIILCDMRKVGNAAEVVWNEITNRYEVIRHAWQISLDSGHTWQKGDYETVDAALNTLPSLVS
jgi:hypothetical protein